jgi:hypothetical protein
MPDGSLRLCARTETCNSTWECPVCAARRSSEWARRIVGAAQKTREREWYAWLVTLTVPHDARTPTAWLVDALANAWRRTIRGEAWVRFRGRVGVLGYVRGAEDTRGTVGAERDHGWHAHLHVYLVTACELDDGSVAWLRDRWQTMCEREGLGRPSDEHGVDVRRARSDGAADYLAKLGLEVSGAERPRSPWAVLEQALSGNRAARRAWYDYARARRGRRRVTLSRSFGWWARAELRPVIEPETSVRFDRDEWRRIRRELVFSGWDAFEADGLVGLLQWADKQGVRPEVMHA